MAASDSYLLDGFINGVNTTTPLYTYILSRVINYSVGDIARCSRLNPNYVLVCTTAGLTAINEPTLSNLNEGDIIQDGTVQWKVVRIKFVVPSIVVMANITTTWSGSTAPYTQTITIPGILPNSNVSLSVTTDATVAQVDQFQALALTDGGQSTNSIILKAWGIKNTASIPIRVWIEP